MSERESAGQHMIKELVAKDHCLGLLRGAAVLCQVVNGTQVPWRCRGHVHAAVAYNGVEHERDRGVGEPVAAASQVGIGLAALGALCHTTALLPTAVLLSKHYQSRKIVQRGRRWIARSRTSSTAICVRTHGRTRLSGLSVAKAIRTRFV